MQRKKLTLAACNFLIPEIAETIKKGDYPDIQLISYQANCASNSLISSAVDTIISKTDPKSDIIIIGSFCTSQNSPIIDGNRKIELVQMEQCFDIFLNTETLYHFMKERNYIVTNGWLRSCKKNIADWGFDKQSAHAFFGESIKSILLLDTKISGDYTTNIKMLSQYMGLPYNVIPVGLSHCQKYLDSIILDWRNNNVQQNLTERISIISKQSADNNLIFNTLNKIVNLTNEKEIITIALDLMNLLFAPSKIIYKTIGLEKNDEIVYNGLNFNNKIDDNNSFNIEINYANQTIGLAQVMGVQFPKYLNRYLDMGVSISQIFGMAITIARKFYELEKSNSSLSLTTKELEELNATKDKFFSIVAHDLKSPYNSILGFSELIIDQIHNKDFDEVSRYADIILQSSQRAVTLLSNLMQWAQSKTGMMEINLSRYKIALTVNEIILTMEQIAKKKSISIYNKISSNVIVNADIAMIDTVLRNLISNAIKFTKEGGSITISSVFKESRYIISVNDTGIGIEKDALSNLFKIDNNYSTPGTNKEIGTGLGLILCKEFIDKHNQTIWVESQQNIGTTFSFTLDA